jgi:restriction system protein
VALALISHLLLNRLAVQSVPSAAQVGQIGVMAVQTIWTSLAAVLQYLVPLLCLAAAGLSAWRRRTRQRLVNDAVQSSTSDALEAMTWQQFELLVGEGFRLQGYQVAELGGGGPDGGVDLVLSRPGRNGSEKFLVQCKQWRAFKVGVDVVRELYGVMAARGAAGGFVVTSGRFTDEAVRFADGRNVGLIDGPKLHALLRQAQASGGRSSAGGATQPAWAPSQAPTRARDQTQVDVPACPLCAKPMQRRIAKRGAHAGGAFWGCVGYPVCRGTRSID